MKPAKFILAASIAAVASALLVGAGQTGTQTQQNIGALLDLAQYDIVLSGGVASAPTGLAPGTSGYPLVSQGSSANPAYAQLGTAGIAANAVTGAKLAAQYSTWNVEDGAASNAALPTSGYPAVAVGYNNTGVTRTITAINCYSDAADSSTVAITDGSGNNLLGATLTCSSSWASATLSGTTTIASGGYIKWTPTPGGTSKEISIIVSGTY